ncbi:MAG: hypothetical protein J0I79_14895 [Mesorhizobium sp.]|uniref:hypothetical protein n=1 Tax=Mesorhizobium sp. TaxID=1871066 RepID=UPI001AD225EE|nr:hypothetical protein [Mesorhizobium sp.]MBN9219237.1 hypothetical protein [Mesorhizobium sp.]
MSEETDKKIETWLSDSHGRGYRIKRYLKGYFYNKVPRDLRFFGLFHWLVKTAMAASSPAVAYFYGSIQASIATMAFAGIFIGHSFAGVLDRLSRDKTSGQSEIQAEMMVRLGDLLSGVKGNAVAQAGRDDAIRACLGIIENYVRLVTRSKKGEVSVSLVLFDGNSATKMKIRHRNPGNERPTNRDVHGPNLIGWHACQRGREPRVLHDLREMPKRVRASPTQSKVGYRSLFFVPVIRARDGSEVVRGFVSIDCQRPYAFYGNRADVIMVTCEPVFSRINDLV